jgi:hypothetical protein
MTDHLPECDRVWNNDFSEESCGICAMLTWVREDQTKILNSRVMYQSGYTDGYMHGEAYGYEKALDHAIACFEEDDVYTAIQALRDL